MKIAKPEISRKDTETFYKVDIESNRGAQKLWYGVQRKYGDMIADSCDGPLAAMLIPAMANGEDIRIAGAISERLYYNLAGPYQKLLCNIIPWLQLIKIYPEELNTADSSASGVATGFSGGIDSFCVLADHFFSDVPGSFKITHLLFNNVGSHGKGGELLFRQRFARLEPLAERIGLPLVMVNSNIDMLYPRHIGFQLSHTIRNASVALMLQNGIGRFMYASGHKVTDVFVGESQDMAFTDTISLPLLSTEALDAFSVGGQYTRVEKTMIVAELPISYNTLDVCVNADHIPPPVNCATCFKCLRTLLTLDFAGVVDRYSEAFNLDLYNQQKEGYIRKILSSEEPLHQELVRFAVSRGYSFPSWMYACSQFHNGANQLMHPVKKLVRKMRRLTA